MQELEFVTLTGLISILQEYKKLYGGHIPILLSDSNSTNLLTGLGSVLAMDMVDPSIGDSQRVMLLTNRSQDQILNDPRFNFMNRIDGGGMIHVRKNPEKRCRANGNCKD